VIVGAPVLRAYLFKYGFYVGYMPTPCRADALMWGVLCAYAIRSPSVLAFFRRWRVMFDMLAVGGIAGLLWPPEFQSVSGLFSLRTALFAYAIARIFFSDGLMRAVLRRPSLVFIGGISYSFYLYHQCINGLMHGIILGQIPRIESAAGFLVAAMTLIVAGTLATISTNYLEMPIRRFARRLKYRLAREVEVPARAPLPVS